MKNYGTLGKMFTLRSLRVKLFLTEISKKLVPG